LSFSESINIGRGWLYLAHQMLSAVAYASICASPFRRLHTRADTIFFATFCCGYARTQTHFTSPKYSTQEIFAIDTSLQQNISHNKLNLFIP
jgi:hypothetical protein